MEKELNQKDIVWSESDNYNATKTVYHGYYSRMRTTEIGNEKAIGNSALCNKNWGIADENENYLPIEEIEDSGLNREKVCKSCLKIYNKLNRGIFNDFEKWLKKFKKSDNDCFWYKKDILFCREAMFEIYLEQL